MSITIATPSNTVKFDIVDGIISAVGRSVALIYLDHRGPCITCSGTNPFCITCSGQPNIQYEASTTIVGSVRWGPSEKKIYTPNGQYIEGDCKVTFSVTDKAATDTLLDKIIRVVVDDRVCIVDKWYYKGAPINRCYLILSEDQQTSGNRIG